MMLHRLDSSRYLIFFSVAFFLGCDKLSKDSYPKSTKATEFIILAQKTIDNPDQAIEYCNEALKVGNDYEKIDALLIQGEVLDKMSKISESVAVFKNALR